MSRKWQTEIESDIGTLQLTVEYYLDYGQAGDYHTPHIPPSIEIQDFKLVIVKPDSTFISHLEDEIMEDETSYDPEDYRD